MEYMNNLNRNLVLLGFKINCLPDRCGSVGWASSYEAKVATLIPSRGTCLGCRLVPGQGIRGATDGCFSLTLMFLFLAFPLLSPSFPLSLRINK